VNGNEAITSEMTQRQAMEAIPKSHRIYAEIIHWLTIISSIAALFVPVFILVNPKNNILNPNLIFGAIFNGAAPAEIWKLSETGAFPGAHYYLQYITKPDSWAMLAVTLGCSVGLWAVIPAVVYQIFKEKDYFCATAGTILAALIFFSMIGVLSM